MKIPLVNRKVILVLLICSLLSFIPTASSIDYVGEETQSVARSTYQLMVKYNTSDMIRGNEYQFTVSLKVIDLRGNYDASIGDVFDFHDIKLNIKITDQNGDRKFERSSPTSGKLYDGQNYSISFVFKPDNSIPNISLFYVSYSFSEDVKISLDPITVSEWLLVDQLSISGDYEVERSNSPKIPSWSIPINILSLIALIIVNRKIR